MNKIPYEEFLKLSNKEKQLKYKDLSKQDKFKVRITPQIKCEVIGKSELSDKEEQRKKHLKHFQLSVFNFRVKRIF